MRCLITGGSGFVGRALTSQALLKGHDVRLALRRPQGADQIVGAEVVTVVEPSVDTNWTAALRNIETVMHLAARVNIMNDNSSDQLAEFRRVNVEMTTALARQAAALGVRRFVFLSSIKVNGEFTQAERPFTSNDVPAPKDSYGVSKHEAEQALRQIAAETRMEVVIIRAPLVYGPWVKANFESMMRGVSRGFPLPLAAFTENRGSLVALDNLVDLIITCLNHPAAANQTFLVSDGEDISTADLLKRTAAVLGHPSRLIYLPKSFLYLLATLANKSEIYQRLGGSLQLDISKTRQTLDWNPPINVDEGLRRAADGFQW